MTDRGTYFEQLDHWKAQAEKEPNPMVQRFGKLNTAVATRTCGQCTDLIRVDRGSRSLFKCVRRGNTRSEASDHRQGWTACALFRDRVP